MKKSEIVLIQKIHLIRKMLGKPFCALQHQKYLFERQANLFKEECAQLAHPLL